MQESGYDSDFKMLLKINTIGYFFLVCNEITEHLRKFYFKSRSEANLH